MKYVKEKDAALRQFNIEQPLLVFVGNRVTATTTDSELSDVEEVLSFLDSFCRNKDAYIARITQVIDNKTGLIIDACNRISREIFSGDFNALWTLYGGRPDPTAVFEDVLRLVMNADTVSDEPRLHVVALKKIASVIKNGLLALRLGFNVTVKEIPLADDGGKNDPDSYCGTKAILDALNEEDFIVWYAKKLFTDNITQVKKREAVTAIAGLIAQIDDEVKQSMYLELVAKIEGSARLWKTAVTNARQLLTKKSLQTSGLSVLERKNQPLVV